MTVLKIGAHSTRKQREETEPHQPKKKKKRREATKGGRISWNLTKLQAQDMCLDSHPPLALMPVTHDSGRPDEMIWDRGRDDQALSSLMRGRFPPRRIQRPKNIQFPLRLVYTLRNATHSTCEPYHNSLKTSTRSSISPIMSFSRLTSACHLLPLNSIFK